MYTEYVGGEKKSPKARQYTSFFVGKRRMRWKI